MQLPLSARLVSRFFSLFGFTAALSLSASAQITPIPQIQGTTDESPLKSQSVTVEGIVTGDFQLKDQFSGFFLQDAKGDGDAATSDGVFVYVNARSKMAGVDVKVGDLVRVAGRVEEFRGQTQIGRASQIEILSSENPIAPTVIELPLPQGASFENFEGMLVSFPQKLVVTAQNELPRYGALLLSAPTRLFVPTNQKPLGQIEDDAARRSFLLDDASGAQSPKPVPYLNENGTRRTGSSVANLTGILSFDFEKYRLQPTIVPVFEDNPRPQTAPVVGGTLKVAVTNLHNYWTTLRTKTNPDARGAKTASEFTRQSAKTVAALRGFDADIVAVMELENNGVTAISDLVGKLNAAYGAKIYAFVADPAVGASRDPIKCGFVYKIAAVSPRGRAVAATDGIFDRFPIAQTFVAKNNGAIFTIVANHFKSKGSPPLTGDVDRGEGAWTQKRLKQAQQLLQFIKKLQVSSGDPDVLTVGDYNAYVEESPIIALRNGGLKHLNLRLPPEERYSYSFDGKFGSLDHALVTPSLDAQIVGFAEWRINSDEPFFLDYPYLRVTNFVADPFRSSDHDPLLIGLNLTPDAVKTAPKTAAKTKVAPPKPKAQTKAKPITKVKAKSKRR